MDLTTPLTYVKGVGPARAAMLEAKGLVTVEDLLGYVPFRYEDRSNMKTIAQLAPGEMATVIAEVRSAKAVRLPAPQPGHVRSALHAMPRAPSWWASGSTAAIWPTCSAEGMKVALYGKVEFDSYAGELTMLHPEFEILSGDDDDGEASLHVGRVVPIYEAVGKITTRVLRTLMHRVLEALAAGGGLPAASTCATASSCRTAGPPSARPTSRRPIPTCACSTPSARRRSSA